MNLSIKLNIVVAAIALTARVSAAGADQVAVDITSLSNGFNYTQGSYSLGFAFRDSEAIDITQLGYYDSNTTGDSETFDPHLVGVYDLTTDTLLASTTVESTDPISGLFHYAPIAPLALNATDTYAIVGVTGTNYYLVGASTLDSAIVDPAINYVSDADNNTITNTLLQPDEFTGDIFGTTPPPTTLGDFGPNFMFTTSPTITESVEPAGGYYEYDYTITGIGGEGDVFIPILDPSGIVGDSLPCDATLIEDPSTIQVVWPGPGNAVASNENAFAMPSDVLEVGPGVGSCASTPMSAVSQTMGNVLFTDTQPPVNGPILVDESSEESVTVDGMMEDELETDDILEDPLVPGPASIPEPPTWMLLGVAVLGTVLLRKDTMKLL